MLVNATTFDRIGDSVAIRSDCMDAQVDIEMHCLHCYGIRMHGATEMLLDYVYSIIVNVLSEEISECLAQ